MIVLSLKVQTVMFDGPPYVSRTRFQLTFFGGPSLPEHSPLSNHHFVLRLCKRPLSVSSRTASVTRSLHANVWSHHYYRLISELVPSNVVVKDSRLKDEDNKDEDLKIGPRGSSRTRTFLEDNNTAVRQYGEIDMNLNLTGAQWQISHSFVTQSLQDDGAWYFACYVSLLNPRKFSRTWTSEDEDKDLK